MINDNYRHRIIVQGILVDHNKVLLTKRAKNKKIAPGKYHIPGGHVEYGEDPEDAIIRELKEELNSSVKPIKVIRTLSYITQRTHEVGIVFLVKLQPQSTIADIKIDTTDNESLAWVDRAEVTNLLPRNDHDSITLTSFFDEL